MRLQHLGFLLYRLLPRAQLVLVLALVKQPAHAKRVALVIANAKCGDMPLRNPVNDATDLSARLQQPGFVVTTLTNRKRSQMTQAIRGFGLTAQGGGAALFYFAGLTSARRSRLR